MNIGADGHPARGGFDLDLGPLLPLRKIVGVFGDLFQSLERASPGFEAGNLLTYSLVLDRLHEQQPAIVLDTRDTRLIGQGLGQVKDASRHVEDDAVEIRA